MAHRKDAATIAMSNRMVVELINPQNDMRETYVVRAQNMHCVVNMAAQIVKEYGENGPIAARGFFNWVDCWQKAISDFEYKHNDQRWLAVYHNGKRIFRAPENEVHPFLDMIEKCDFGNTNAYDYAIPMAQELLKQSGKPIALEYDGNVALNVQIENNEARIGVILRSSSKTTTFSFSIKPRLEQGSLDISQSLEGAASFLEGVQLAFQVGMSNEKLRMGIFKRLTPEHQQTREGRARLEQLATEIGNLQTIYDVRYRPEKPNFDKLVSEAEAFGHRTLEPPEDSDYIS